MILSLEDPGTDVEDERATPVGSPLPVVDGVVPLSAPSGLDMELAHVFQDVGVLPAMVTPIVDPEGGVRDDPCGDTPCPRFPDLSVVMSDPLDAGFPC